MLFVLLSLWQTLLSVTVTSTGYFCNVCDWPTAQENVRWGDMLDYNHTSLTWHIMTLSATAPPLSVTGHKLLGNRPQECRRFRHEEKHGRGDKREGPGGDKVFLCAKIHLFLCLSHILLPLSIRRILLFPCSFLSVGRVPSQNMC